MNGIGEKETRFTLLYFSCQCNISYLLRMKVESATYKLW